MAEPAKDITAQEPDIRGSKAQVDDYFKGLMKDYLDEDGAEQIIDTMERQRENWEKMPNKEKVARVRAGLEGRLDRPVGAAKGKENLWFMKGKEHDADYEAGSGKKFADVLPFMFRSKKDKGRVDWEYVTRLASDGIKFDGRTFKNKAIGQRLEKSLEAGSVTSGGALIPEDFSSDFIGYLYDTAVIRQAGARTVEMPNGSLDLGRQGSTATAYWVGESAQITASDEEFERVRLEAKKLGVVVKMSNDVVRRVPRGMEQLVQDDMVTIGSLAEDLAFIRGSGTNGEPKGILNSVKSSHKFDSAGDTTGDIVSDLMKAVSKVRTANIPMSSPAWMMSARTHSYLMQLQDADNNLVSFMQQLSQGTLFGFPVFVTNQIPTNLGTGSDDTEIYFGDFSQALIGETLNLQVDTSPHATVGGDNLFEQDMQALRLVHEVDFALRHPEAFSVIEAFDADTGFGT